MALFDNPWKRLSDLELHVDEPEWDSDSHISLYNDCSAKLIDEQQKKKGKHFEDNKATLRSAYLAIAKGLWGESRWDKLRSWIVEEGPALDERFDLDGSSLDAVRAVLVPLQATVPSQKTVERTLAIVRQVVAKAPNDARAMAALDTLIQYSHRFGSMPPEAQAAGYLAMARLAAATGRFRENQLFYLFFLKICLDSDRRATADELAEIMPMAQGADAAKDDKRCALLVHLLTRWCGEEPDEVAKLESKIQHYLATVENLDFGQFTVGGETQAMLLLQLLAWSIPDPGHAVGVMSRLVQIGRLRGLPDAIGFVEAELERHGTSSDMAVRERGRIGRVLSSLLASRTETAQREALETARSLYAVWSDVPAENRSQIVEALSGLGGTLDDQHRILLDVDVEYLTTQDGARTAEKLMSLIHEGRVSGQAAKAAELRVEGLQRTAGAGPRLLAMHSLLVQGDDRKLADYLGGLPDDDDSNLVIQAAVNGVVSREIGGYLVDDPIAARERPLDVQQLTAMASVDLAGLALSPDVPRTMWSTQGSAGIDEADADHRLNLLDLVGRLLENQAASGNLGAVVALSWVAAIRFRADGWDTVLPTLSQCCRGTGGLEIPLRLVIADVAARRAAYRDAFEELWASGAAHVDRDLRLASLLGAPFCRDALGEGALIYRPAVTTGDDPRLLCLLDFVRPGNELSPELLQSAGQVFVTLARFQVHRLLEVVGERVFTDLAEWVEGCLRGIGSAVLEDPSTETSPWWRPWAAALMISDARSRDALECLRGLYDRVGVDGGFRPLSVAGAAGVQDVARLAFADRAVQALGPEQPDLVPLLVEGFESDDEVLRAERKRLLFSLREPGGEAALLSARLAAVELVATAEDLELVVAEALFRTGREHADRLGAALDGFLATDPDPDAAFRARMLGALLAVAEGEPARAWDRLLSETPSPDVRELAMELGAGIGRMVGAGLVDGSDGPTEVLRSVCRVAEGGDDALRSYQGCLASEAASAGSMAPFSAAVQPTAAQSPWIRLLATVPASTGELVAAWMESANSLKDPLVCRALHALLEALHPRTDDAPVELGLLHAVGMAWSEDPDDAVEALGIFAEAGDAIPASGAFVDALQNLADNLAAAERQAEAGRASRIVGRLLEQTDDRAVAAKVYLTSLKYDRENYPKIEEKLDSWSEEERDLPEAQALRMEICRLTDDHAGFLTASEHLVERVAWWSGGSGIDEGLISTERVEYFAEIGAVDPALATAGAVGKGFYLLAAQRVADAVGAFDLAQTMDPVAFDPLLDRLEAILEHTTDHNLHRAVIRLHLASQDGDFNSRGVHLLAEHVTDTISGGDVDEVVAATDEAMPLIAERSIDPTALYEALATVLVTERFRSEKRLAAQLVDVAAAFPTLSEQVNHTLGILDRVDPSCQEVFIAAARGRLGDDLLAHATESIDLGVRLFKAGHHRQCWDFLVAPLRKQAVEDPDERVLGDIWKVIAAPALEGNERSRQLEALAWAALGMGDETLVVESSLELLETGAWEALEDPESLEERMEFLYLAHQRYRTSGWQANLVIADALMRAEPARTQDAVGLLESVRQVRDGEDGEAFLGFEGRPFHPDSVYSWEFWTDRITACYEDLRRWADAIGIYRWAIQRESALEDKGEGWAHRQKMLRSGLWKAKDAEIRRLASNLEASGGDGVKAAEQALELAELNRRFGFPHGVDFSVSLLRKAMGRSKDGRRARVLVNLARCQAEAGVFAAARETLELMGGPPDDHELRVEMLWTSGEVHQHLGRFSEAAARFAQALAELDPLAETELYRAVERRLKEVQMQAELLWESPKYIAPKVDLLTLMERGIGEVHDAD